MPECPDEIQDCDLMKEGLETLFKKLLRMSVEGCLSINVSGISGGGGGGDVIIEYPTNNAFTTEYFTGPDNAAAIAALNVWKAAGGNATKKIIDITPMTGNDGVTGIMVRWIA